MILLPLVMLIPLTAWLMYRDRFSRQAALSLVPRRSARRRSLHTGRRL